MFFKRNPNEPPPIPMSAEQRQMYETLRKADSMRRRRDSLRALFVVFVVIPAVVAGVIALVLWRVRY